MPLTHLLHHCTTDASPPRPQIVFDAYKTDALTTTTNKAGPGLETGTSLD
jgi:hypothetical protein